MNYKRLIEYICLHLGAVERSEDLHRWIQSWWPDDQVSPLMLLATDNWFELDDQRDCVLWSRPPVAVAMVVEMVIMYIHGKIE